MRLMRCAILACAQFLIGRNGKPVKRYPSTWEDDKIREDVAAAVAQPFEDAEPF